jgi:hypothetical protein
MDDSSNKSVVTATDKPAQGKKPYERPVLAKWGSLRDMTQSTGSSGKSDSGGKGWSKNTGRGGHFVIKE